MIPTRNGVAMPGQRQLTFQNGEIPHVFAYRDAGRPALGARAATRWKPRKVVCTKSAKHEDLPGAEYVVKYIRQGNRRAESAAALISEMLCSQLLALCRIRRFKPAYVTVSDRFAKACKNKDEIEYDIDTGIHFGTQFAPEIEPDAPSGVGELREPEALVRLWVFDSWVMNIDRQRYGNTVWELSEPDMKWELIAADQSDCFCGAGYFASGDYLDKCETFETANTSSDLVHLVISEQGTDAIFSAIDSVQQTSESLGDIIPRVPEKWWELSTINPDRVIYCLSDRADRLRDIINPDQWEVPGNGFSGGVIIDV